MLPRLPWDFRSSCHRLPSIGIQVVYHAPSSWLVFSWDSSAHLIAQLNVAVIDTIIGPVTNCMVRTGSECENGQACKHLVDLGQPADIQMPILKLCQQLVTPNPHTESSPLSVSVNSILLENSHASSLSVDAFVLKL